MKWSVIEQWKRKLDVEARQMESAELDDVDERSASCDWRTPDGRNGTFVRTG